MARLLVPNHSRPMGWFWAATRGAGKSRSLGRVVCLSDLRAGVAGVLADGVGGSADNLLDACLRLTRAEQEQFRLRERLIYVDMATTGLDGHVCPFPLLYRLPGDTLYDAASRFVNLCIKVDKDLRNSPLLGANQLTRIGTYAGMVLLACGCQLTEAVGPGGLLDEPARWAPRIEAALAAYPDELSEAAHYFLATYPRLPERERKMETAALRAKLTMLADPLQRAIYGADAPGIEWEGIALARQFVILDFRRVPEHRKRWAVCWAHQGLLEFVRRRGPGRHAPFSIVVDEASYLVGDRNERDDPLAAELTEIVNRLSRNTRTQLLYAVQELHTLSEPAAALFLDLGILTFGATSSLDSAMRIARRFYRWDPHWVRKRDPIYGSFMGEHYVIDHRDVEYSRDDQVYLNALQFMSLPAFTFLMGVAPREGQLPTRLTRISLAEYDKDKYVQEELVAEARALLMKRHPRVADVLAGIAARQTTVSSSPATARVIPVIPLTHDGHVGEITPDGHDTSLRHDAPLTNLPPVTPNGGVPPLRRRARATQPPTQPGLAGAGGSAKKR